jgi:aryl-alcohol dehydrogenase-like predicted oxidoreductase
VGLLAGRSFDVRGKEAQSARTSLVHAAIESGVDFFATSPAHGEAERVLAACLAGRRRHATVLTMISSLDGNHAQRDLDRALHYFDGYIDVCLLEWDAASPEMLATLRRMRAAREAVVTGVHCRTLGQLPFALDALEDLGCSALAFSAPLLALPSIDAAIARAHAAGAGVLAYLPDGRLPPAGHVAPRELEQMTRLGVASWHELWLKLALGDERVSSAIVPVARVGELARIRAVARPPWLGAAERALVRGGLRPA